MHFAFNEEQEELRSMARAFLQEHSSGDAVRAAMETELGYDEKVWQQIASELGWTALAVPEEHGGLGLSAVELTALLEITGEHLLCSPFFSTSCLATPALLQCGAEAGSPWLQRIAEGDLTATLALAEESGHYDLDAVETTARPDGDGFVLDGRKRFVVDGHSAGLILVVARSDAGLGLYAVPADSEGLARKFVPTMDATRKLADLELSGVRVPAEACIGEPGSARPGLARTLDLARIALAAEQVGGASRCLDLSVEYAKERVQFGRPIGSFQAIKHACADLCIQVECARSAAYYAACMAEAPEGELAMNASLVQSYCSEAFFQCASEAIQIHGGVGFTWEYDVHLFFKRARASESFLGTPSEHREHVATRLGLS